MTVCLSRALLASRQRYPTSTPHTSRSLSSQTCPATAQVLIALLGSEAEDVRRRAGSTLKRMSAEGGAESQMSVQMAGGIERFVALLRDGSSEAQEYTLSLLVNASDVASKRSISHARCAQPVIALMVRETPLSAVALEHAAALLALLTADQGSSVYDAELRAANAADLLQADGVPPLVALLTSGSVGAKRHVRSGPNPFTWTWIRMHARTHARTRMHASIASIARSHARTRTPLVRKPCSMA
jgi:hypothetical protein